MQPAAADTVGKVTFFTFATLVPREMLSLNAPFQGIFYAVGRLQALAHFEIGGTDLEWSGDEIRHEHSGAGCSFFEAVASCNMKCMSVTQTHLMDSVLVSSSTHIQHTQRLLQVYIDRSVITLAPHLILLLALDAA